MDYFESKIRIIGKWRLMVLLINIAVMIVSIYGFYNSGFFSRYWYSSEKAIFFSLLITYSLVNSLCILTPVIEKSEDEKSLSLLGLWLKRKRLENESKIKELEK